MATAIATQKISKSEMKSLATKMVANNEKCLKANFSKNFPYDAFKAIYTAVSEEATAKRIAKMDAEYLTAFCKRNKITQKFFNTVSVLLQNINLNEYKTGHSMGCLGSISLMGNTIKRMDCTDTYAKSCTWKPVHGSYQIYVSKELALKLQNCYYEKIGNVDTFIVPTSDKIKKCFWLEEKGSKNNYSVSIVEGFFTNGFHAKTVKECEAWRAKEALRIKTTRIELSEIEKKKARFVGLSHSIKVGNCEAGTLNFAKKYNLDTQMGYKVGFLLSLENSTYTQRLLSI